MKNVLRDGHLGRDPHGAGSTIDYSAFEASPLSNDPKHHRMNGSSALERKLSGKPRFLSEDQYCTGSGDDGDDANCVQLVASVDFPTRYGNFRLFGFYEAETGAEHTAIVHGEVEKAVDCPVRVHSECHTGDVWGSLRCDCREQLEAAIKFVASQDRGAVIYLRQEGRGIGLLNKIKAYHLQDLGLDTVEANEYLGYPAEARDYGVAARILELLGIRSVALLTNNPDKIDKLTLEGVEVTRRIPIQMPTNPHNAFYMETKKEKMGHLFR